MLLFIIILLFCLFVISVACESEVGVRTSLISIILLITSFVASFFNHSDDLSLIRTGQPLVVIREEAIKDIDKQLDKLKFSQTSLMNNDSPAKSLIETKSKYISELTVEKLKIQQARINIEARSIGLLKFVVWLYGKE